MERLPPPGTFRRLAAADQITGQPADTMASAVRNVYADGNARRGVLSLLCSR